MNLLAVAFKCGGVIEEYVKNGVNCYIVNLRDIKAFSEKVIDLSLDDKKHLEFSKNAHKTISKQYSFEKFSNEYNKLISNREKSANPWPKLRPVFKPKSRMSIDGLL